MAAAQYFEQVQKIFIAFYQRPADPAGLKYWAERVDAAGGNINEVINAFASSAEATTLYGAIDATTIGDVVDSLYMALFNTAPDAAGKAFYVDGFAAGTFTAGTIALAVLNGAQNDDLIAVNNKVQVANEFTHQVDGRALSDAYFGTGSSFNATYAGDADTLAARAILKAVTFSPATVLNPAQVTAQIQSQIANPGDTIIGQTGGQTFVLTTGVDTGAAFTGTAGNDTFVGVADGTIAAGGTPSTNTFGGLDNLDGGAGTDTLKLTNANGAAMTLATSVTVKNIENLELTNASGAVTADVQAWTGLQSVVVDQKAAAASTVNTKANATSVSIKGGNAAAIIDNGTGIAATKDTLASVTIEKVAGSATVNTDALTTLNVIDNAHDVTVTAAAGTRVLNLGLNKVVGGTITDAEATGLKIAATGANSSKITLTTVKATTIDFSGDKTVSLDLGAAGNQAANLVITSSNTAGVTLAGALDTDVTFTGAAGKDSVIVGATTKTIDMGAGDDTVEVTAALGLNGKLVGGDGVDTLKFSAANAQTLSATDTFAKAVTGFEKVSVEAVAALTDNTVNLANLNNINYVVSAGTGASGVTETSNITFGALLAGQSLTVGGRTVTASTGPATDAQVATAFSSGTSTGTLTVSGTLTGFTAGAVTSGNTVLFSSSVAGPVGDIVLSAGTVAAPAAPIANTVQGDAAGDVLDGNANGGVDRTETAQIFFTDLLVGQSVNVGGRIVTAATGGATAAQVADAFNNNAGSGTLTVDGTLTGWSSGSLVANSVVLTSGTASQNVTDVVITPAGTAAATAPTPTTVQGTAGSSLTVTNMANAGTFELTGVVAGAATVTMKDATGTADSLNIRLNGAANIVNTGTLTVAGVETINLEATDSSVDTITLTNPDAASKPNLVAADATKIVVTGNHGVDFTGSTLTKLVDLDASGVVATGATTGATAAQIATAGAVTFTSAVTDKNVTVKTGNGADVINLSSVVDVTKGATVTTGEGGDTITGTAGNDTIDAGAGRDTVNASAGADTITLGAGNDVYVLGAATNSTLAKGDTITDFVANTKGLGTTADQIKLGATGTVADLTGDTINVSAAITLAGVATTGITVFVATNAADAQTFLQNTGNAGTLTGFALDSTTGKLYMDFDSNGTVDSVITLTGVTTITEAAFVTGLAV